MSLFQLLFECDDKSFRVQRSTDDDPVTHDEIRTLVDQSCEALGFATPEDMRGQGITVKLIEESDPAFLMMEAKT